MVWAEAPATGTGFQTRTMQIAASPFARNYRREKDFLDLQERLIRK